MYRSSEPRVRRHDFPSSGQAIYSRIAATRERDAVARAMELPHAVEIKPALDLQKLDNAVRQVVAKHSELRAIFHVRPHEVRVEWLDPDEFRLRIIPAEQFSDSELTEIVRGDASKGWRSTTEPLFRMSAYAARSSTVILIEMSHLVVEGWSAELVFRDLMAAYLGLQLPQPDTRTFEDFVDWEMEFVDSPEGRRQFEYWQQQIKAMPTPLKLPHDRPQVSDLIRTGGIHRFDLGPQLTRSMHALRLDAGVTMVALLLSAWAFTIARLSGADDLPIQIPFARRDRAGLQEVVGHTMNLHCVRVRVAGDETVTDFVRNVGRKLTEALDHQDYPMWLHEDFQAQLGAAAAARTGYRQVGFSAFTPNRNDPLGFAALLQDPAGGKVAHAGFEAKVLELPLGYPCGCRDLYAQISPSSERVRGWLRYNADVFNVDTAGKVVDELCNSATRIVQEPATALCKLL